MQVSGDMRLLKGVRLPGFKIKVPEKRIAKIPARRCKRHMVIDWLRASMDIESIGV
jgi:hypothetical protein